MTIQFQTGKDSATAFVYKQNPEFSADATLQLGSSIYLWLTVDSTKLVNDSAKISIDTIPKLVRGQL